jgi:hypothetical protein
MRNAYIASWARDLLFPPPVRAGAGEDRSAYGRFAIPYTFKPQWSFLEAVMATAGAFLRVLLGCVAFSVWGTHSTIRNPFWWFGVLLPLLLSFLTILRADHAGDCHSGQSGIPRTALDFYPAHAREAAAS